jgi:hypothetical protein
VKPDVLISRKQPSHLGADDSDNIPQHGYDNHPSIESENKTRTSGNPDRESETIECSEFLVCLLDKQTEDVVVPTRIMEPYLAVPSVGEHKKLKAIPNDIEGKPSWSEKLLAEPAFTHGI